MTEIDYKYTLEVDENSWFVRLYKWVWEPEDEINFCKLFWGYLLMPAAIFLKYLVFKPVFWIFSKLDSFLIKKEEEKRQILIETGQFPKSKSSVLMNKFIKKTENTWQKVNLFLLDHNFFKYLAKGLLWGFIGILSVALAGGFVLLCITYPLKVLAIALLLLGTLGGIVAGTALGMYVSEKHAKRVKRTKNSFINFGKSLRAGYIAVKTNTCPKIELKNAKNIPEF